MSVVLKSSDDQEFTVTKEVAKMSRTVSNIMEGACRGGVVGGAQASGGGGGGGGIVAGAPFTCAFWCQNSAAAL